MSHSAIFYEVFLLTFSCMVDKDIFIRQILIFLRGQQEDCLSIQDPSCSFDLNTSISFFVTLKTLSFWSHASNIIHTLHIKQL